MLINLIQYLNQDKCNEKSISKNAKPWHYQDRVYPCNTREIHGHYSAFTHREAAKVRFKRRKFVMEELNVIEIKVLRQFLRTIKDLDQYRKHHNDELYTYVEKTAKICF